MINLTQAQLTELISSSLLLGAILGVIYELFRFIKYTFSVNGRKGAVFSYILTFFCDFIFCLLFAFVAILQSYRISGGIFRGISYIGMLSGLLLYYFTLGKLTLKINRKFALFVRKTVQKILKLVSIPIRAIFSLIFKLYTLTIGKISVEISSLTRLKHSTIFKTNKFSSSVNASFPLSFSASWWLSKNSQAILIISFQAILENLLKKYI